MFDTVLIFYELYFCLDLFPALFFHSNLYQFFYYLLSIHLSMFIILVMRNTRKKRFFFDCCCCCCWKVVDKRSKFNLQLIMNIDEHKIYIERSWIFFFFLLLLKLFREQIFCKGDVWLILSSFWFTIKREKIFFSSFSHLNYNEFFIRFFFFFAVFVRYCSWIYCTLIKVTKKIDKIFFFFKFYLLLPISVPGKNSGICVSMFDNWYG